MLLPARLTDLYQALRLEKDFRTRLKSLLDPIKKEVIKVRKLTGSALVALMLMLTGVGSFAATQQSSRQNAAAQTMVTGEVALIKEHTLRIKDRAGNGQTYRLCGPVMVQVFKAGEKITLALENTKWFLLRNQNS
jgi:hypothetical protein